MTLPFGIDISRYQYSADGRVKPDFGIMNASCDFVAVRAGISWGYTDPWFAYSWEHLTVPRLAYHVVYPGEDAGRQMAHFLRIVKPGERDRLVLDLELDHGHSRAKITDMTVKCLEVVRRETGRYPIIYSRATWVNSFLEVSDLPELDWWLASYLNRQPYPLYTPEKMPPPLLPNGVARWLIHQTSERGNGAEVGVVSRYVDTDRWNGTQAELEAYFGVSEEAEPGKPVLFQARVYFWATPHVHVRTEPSTTSAEVGQVSPLGVVDVTDTRTDWYETHSGWMMSKYLERLDTEQPPILLGVPALWQRDPRWANDLLGNSRLTIGNFGCLLTAVAMTLTWYGKQTDPAQLNAALKKVGGFTGANLYWQAVQMVQPDVRLGTSIDCMYTPAPLEVIDGLLAEKIPVLVHVDFNPSTPQVEQHWVLIIGKAGDDYIINDPWTGERRRFRESYGEPERYIFRIRAYRREIK